MLGISAKKFQDLKKIFSDTPLFKGVMPKPYGNKKNWTLLSKFEIVLLSLLGEVHHSLGIPYIRLKDLAVSLYEKVKGDPEFLLGKKDLVWISTDLSKKIDWVVSDHDRKPKFELPLGNHLSKLENLKKTGV